MRTAGFPGHADEPNGLTSFYFLTDINEGLFHVAIDGIQDLALITKIVLDGYSNSIGITVLFAHKIEPKTGMDHGAGAGSKDLSPFWGGDIDAGVWVVVEQITIAVAC